MMPQVVTCHAGLVDGPLQGPVLGGLKLEEFIFLDQFHVFDQSFCHQIKHQIEAEKNP